MTDGTRPRRATGRSRPCRARPVAPTRLALLDRACPRLRRARRDRDRGGGLALSPVGPAALVDLRRRDLARLADARGAGRDTAVRPAAPAPPLRLTDQDGRPFDLASLRGRPGPRLLRLHALPRRLPDEPRRRPRRAQADRRRGRRRLRHDRSRPRRRGGHEAVRGLLPGRLHRAHRHRRRDPGCRRRLGRLVRQGGIRAPRPATRWPTRPTPSSWTRRGGSATGSGSGPGRR